jgi:hypothetical protein
MEQSPQEVPNGSLARYDDAGMMPPAAEQRRMETGEMRYIEGNERAVFGDRPI